MRYNTYRQYKTLSGYDDRREKISTVIQYVEKNYQFQWQSYDLIKTIPSADFDSLMTMDGYDPGMRFKFVILPNSFIQAAEVYKHAIGGTSNQWTKVGEIGIEPNTFIYNIRDPEATTDSVRDVTLRAYDSNNQLVVLLNGEIDTTSVDAYSITWSFLETATANSQTYMYFNVLNFENYNTRTWSAMNVSYFTVDVNFDSNDTQEGVAPFPVFVPKFVPVD